MNVVPDTNIFIHDPWLRSNKTRMLLDYLETTDSRLILLEAVEKEIWKVLRCDIEGMNGHLNRARRLAGRWNVQNFPDPRPEAQAWTLYEAWLAHITKLTRDGLILRVPVADNIIGEVLRRATHGVPPCTPDGGEIQDAIVWLSFLEYAKRQDSGTSLAFLSDDSGFRSGESLRPELQDDLAPISAEVQYYRNLNSLLQKQSEPIEHVTESWILEKLDLDAVRLDFTEKLKAGLGLQSLRIADEEAAEHYRIVSPAAVAWSRPPEISSFFVYEYSGGERVVSIILSVEVEGECLCEIVDRSALPLFPQLIEKDRHRQLSLPVVLPCYGDLLVSLSAALDNGGLKFNEVENIDYR